MIRSEVLFNSKCNLYNYMYNIIPNLFGRENITYLFRDTDSIIYKIKNCPYEKYLDTLKDNPHLFSKNLGLIYEKPKSLVVWGRGDLTLLFSSKVVK